MEFEIVGEWFEHLIWCPSQCYLNINVNGKPYHIYLRWRHEDPWTCKVVTNHVDMTWTKKGEHDWIILDLLDMYGVYLTKDDPIEVVEEKAIEVAKNVL